jgi:hypothetical protein
VLGSGEDVGPAGIMPRVSRTGDGKLRYRSYTINFRVKSAVPQL